MSDSLSLKVAKVQKELLLSRSALQSAVTAGDLAVVLEETDAAAAGTRIVICATQGAESIVGTGIYDIMVKDELRVQGPTDSALVDTYLAEIDLANRAAPGSPSTGYAAALAALSDYVRKDDEDTAQDDAEEIHKLERTFTVAAKLA